MPKEVVDESKELLKRIKKYVKDKTKEIKTSNNSLKEVAGKDHEYQIKDLKEIIDKTKELLKTILKNDKDKTKEIKTSNNSLKEVVVKDHEYQTKELKIIIDESKELLKRIKKNDKDKTKEIKTSNNSLKEVVDKDHEYQTKELKKIIDETKELLKRIKKNNEIKKYTSADDILKRLNAKAEDIRKTNEVLKEYYKIEAKKASEEGEKFNKMINDNLDMSSEKSEIINRLIEFYSLRRLYYLNNANNNLKANEKIDDDLISREINELEKRLRDQHKKDSGMFTSQKSFAKLLTFLAQLRAGNNSKKLKHEINRLLKALYQSKQKSKLVYENLIAAI